MSASPGVAEFGSALFPTQCRELSDGESVLESPSLMRRVGWMMTNPWKNTLLPAALLRSLMSRSRSPLIAESLARPGGWRAMEIIYAQAPAVDWLDRQALYDNPVCMAARNRRRIVTGILTQLLAEAPADHPITMLGVGAGPGRHIQTAIAHSGLPPERIQAYLIDRDDDAFRYGRDISSHLGTSACVRFIQGDARQIRETLPDVSASIVKVVGLAEYLNDQEFVGLFSALREVMAPHGTLVTHGFVDYRRSGQFLSRVFQLRHTQRNEVQMRSLLSAAGFRVTSCVTEPVRIHPILTAVRTADGAF